MQAPVDTGRAWTEAGEPGALGSQSGQKVQGPRDQNQGTDNNQLLSPEARYGKLLPKENLLELSHVRKGSGPSNRWSLPRQQVFQSTHESGVTDRPTKELQVQDPKAFAGFCGLSVRANTADILYSYSFQLKSNFRCSIKAVPLVCQSE